jgi:hypothetical protein
MVGMMDWMATNRCLTGAILALSILAICFGGFGGIAILQLWAILDGSYDPVLDDGMRPEEVPKLKRRLVCIGLPGVVAGIAGSVGLWATSAALARGH